MYSNISLARIDKEPFKNYFVQQDAKNDRKVFCDGLHYLLPLFAVANLRMDVIGKFHIQLSRENVLITSRLRFNFMFNTDKDYMAYMLWVITKYFSASAHYKNDMKFGAGLTIIY